VNGGPPPPARVTLAATAGGLVAVYLAIRFAWPFVLTLVVGGVVYYLLSPAVDALERRVPRAAAATAVYATFVVVTGLALLALAPRVSSQLESLGRDLPGYATEAERWLTDQGVIGAEADPRVRDAISSAGERLDGLAVDAAGAAVSTFAGVLGWLVATVFGLALGLYLLVGGPKLAQALPHWFPPGQRDRWIRFGRAASGVLAGYLRARLIASLFVGTAYGLAFWALGVEPAMLLGVVGGLLNVVPVVGPFLGALPALAVAAFASPTAVVAVVVVMVVVQQVESAVLNPHVEGRYVRLPPAVVVMVAAAGSALAGIAGLLLAVPVAGIVRAALDTFYRDGWASASRPVRSGDLVESPDGEVV
jgi:predicted PurR-regulated permease PerM